MYQLQPFLDAIAGITQPTALALMLGGVVVSSIFAALPGIGSLLCLSIAVPLSLTLSPYECIAFLLGITTVGNTANTFSSVLIAVPGGAGSQATIVDGHPMARKGEANRAFGAAFSASALGAVFGALVFAVTLPILQPLVLSFGTPAFMMLVLWGLSAVAVLGGTQPVKGLLAAVLGLAIGLIGTDLRTGVERFVFDDGGYLFQGISVIVIALGMFAVPELIALAVRRTSVSESGDLGDGLWQGVRDTFRNWWLVIRCSIIGVWIGVLPGLGSSVADWFAYAHTVQSEKNPEMFGHGDVRGVIGPESSNNAKDGGSLIPTLLFGIPGSTSMALCLIPFVAVGITPGKAMLEGQINYLYAMLLVLVISNLFATAIAMAFSRPFAKISIFPFYVIVPGTLVLCTIAAFNVSFTISDLIAFAVLSTLGFYMKRYGWPRPPLLVAVVLGPQLQNYMWLTYDLHRMRWVTHTDVLILFGVIVLTMLFPLYRRLRDPGRKPQDMDIISVVPRGPGEYIFLIGFLGVLVFMIDYASIWPQMARFPVEAIAGTGILLGALQLGLQVRRDLRRRHEPETPVPACGPPSFRTRREIMSALWIAGLLSGIWLIGFRAAFLIFPVAYVMAHGGSWKLGLALGAGAVAVLLIIFDSVIHIVWPEPYLLELLTGLR